MKYNTFLDVQEKLTELGMFHMDLSLSRMKQFADAWDAHATSQFSILHVVGTNGKGSTSTFFEHLAREHGLCTGLYTSPHFLSPRERVLVTGRMLDEAIWVQLANRLTEICPELGLTYFEWLTCLAVLAFENSGVDVAIMEAGLGGRYDAIRVFAPKLVLLTPVGLDHEAYLGDTLAKVADDKSRAISRGCVAITAEQEPEVMEVYTRRAAAVGATLHSAAPVADMPLGLAGAYQHVNAGLALAGWRAWCAMNGLTVDEHACERGLRNAWMPGRFQRVAATCGEPAYILDGAHNGHGLRALGQSLAVAGIVPDAILFACMRDKDVAEMRGQLMGLTAGPVYAVELPGNERALPGRELARMLGSRATSAASVELALTRARQAGAKTVLVCGSLYLLAEFYKLHPHLLEPAR